MDVSMPQLGETVTEGTITRWLKRVGDEIRADEPLFEVSTDKVDSEVPAPAAGVLSEIRVAEGDTVPVGTVLAVIGEPGSVPAPPPAPEAEPPAPAPGRSAPAPERASAPAPEPAPERASVPAPEPAPERASVPAPEPAPEPPAPAPASPAEAVTSSAEDAGAPAPGIDDPRFTSPVVRRLVVEQGIDPATIVGTGHGGRVSRKDVLDAIARTRDADAPSSGVAGTGPAEAETEPPPAAEPPATPATAAAAAPAAPAAPAARAQPEPSAAPEAIGTVVKMSTIRRRIAEHMVRSRATSAHAYTSVEVDFEHVASVRRAHRDEWRSREGFSLTYLPFIIRAVSDMIDDYPVVNASIDENNLVLHPALHLGIAVDLEFEGLVAPVVRDAASKRLRQLARDVHDLASRARSKQLKPDVIAGGTFTITNPGPYGTYQTLPIINQPQVAILATDGIAKRPVVMTGPDGGDVLAIRHTGLLTLAWDHRAFDGAYAAAFLDAVRGVLETRDWETELE